MKFMQKTISLPIYKKDSKFIYRTGKLKKTLCYIYCKNAKFKSISSKILFKL